MIQLEFWKYPSGTRVGSKQGDSGGAGQPGKGAATIIQARGAGGGQGMGEVVTSKI